jgi:hypothetical protein
LIVVCAYLPHLVVATSFSAATNASLADSLGGPAQRVHVYLHFGKLLQKIVGFWCWWIGRKLCVRKIEVQGGRFIGQTNCFLPIHKIVNGHFVVYVSSKVKRNHFFAADTQIGCFMVRGCTKCSHRLKLYINKSNSWSKDIITA